MFHYKDPITNKELDWKPLTVGEEIDIEAAYSGAQKYMQSYELLRRRIIRFDGKEGAPEMAAFRQWDGLALELFVDEVQKREQERREKFTKGSADPLPDSST